ncbi:MAG: HAD family hydrolase [Deltaproteobacteria bacterium]
MAPGSFHRRAVFLDRDGTINEEVGYLRSLDDLVLIEGAAEGIRLLNGLGLLVVVATNQSGVARGYFDESFVFRVHAEIDRRLAQEGARVDAWYVCPHHPTEGRDAYRISCGCRKPAPGLLLRAGKDLGIDLARSWFVGDTAMDMECASAAGTKGILVLTGKGQLALSQIEGRNACPEFVAPDLFSACKWIRDHGVNDGAGNQ